MKIEAGAPLTEALDNKMRDYIRSKNIPMIALDEKTEENRLKEKITESDIKRYVRFAFNHRPEATDGVKRLRQNPDRVLRMAKGETSYFLKWKPPSSRDRISPVEDANPYYHWAFRRHNTWFPKIEKELEEGGAFISVGLSHLTGFSEMVDQPPSLVEFLESRGFEVTFIGDCQDVLIN
jgi:hypothetical protein